MGESTRQGRDAIGKEDSFLCSLGFVEVFSNNVVKKKDAVLSGKTISETK